MSENSAIEWTQSTWNPLTGCTKISAGCANCYAERMTRRLHGIGVQRYANGFRLTMHEDVMETPLRWKKRQIIFVNSMSDLFHKDVSFSFIQKVFETMRLAHWHQFQVLTKRAERLAELSPWLDWPENVWMGVTVESGQYTHRIDCLRKTAARIKFLSLEPLLAPIPHMDLKGINWVIVGGESGPYSRPINAEWVTDIQKQCREADIPFFSSNGAGGTKKRTAGCFKVAHGTKCLSCTRFKTLN